MKVKVQVAVLAAIVVAAVISLHAQKTPDKQSEIARALSAAPSSVSKDAAVVAIDEKGHFTELRKGSNGWTCIPRDPGTPLGHPVCVDQNGLEWFHEAMAGRAPDPTKVGYCYMLKGGSVWSNTDVAATKLPVGEKTYITIPPHVMIFNAKLAEQSGFPSGPHPDTSKPFVMYGGTPYAVITLPVK